MIAVFAASKFTTNEKNDLELRMCRHQKTFQGDLHEFTPALLKITLRQHHVFSLGFLSPHI